MKLLAMSYFLNEMEEIVSEMNKLYCASNLFLKIALVSPDIVVEDETKHNLYTMTVDEQ